MTTTATATRSESFALAGMSNEDRLDFLERVNHWHVQVYDVSRNFRTRKFVDTDLPNLEHAEYAVFNRTENRPMLTIDIDSKTDTRIDLAEVAARLLEAGIPFPNLVGVNVLSGNCQLIWYLENPVYGTGKHYRKYLGVAKRLTCFLSADRHFARRVQRNPLSVNGEYQWHFQHAQTQKLDGLNVAEIPEVLDTTATAILGDALITAMEQQFSSPSIEASFIAKLTTDKEGLQRSTYLFDKARFYAFSLRIAGHTVTPADLMPLLIETNNELRLKERRRTPISISAMLSTAASVSTYVNREFVPSERGRGGGAPRYSPIQCYMGGLTQGGRNARSGQVLDFLKSGRDSRAVSRTARAAEMREFALAGFKTTKEIAGRFDVSVATAEADLAGIPSRPYRIQRAVLIYVADRKTSGEIATIIGISKRQVNRILANR